MRILEKRSQLLQTLRSYFLDQGFIEVQTPILTKAPAPERHIETFYLPEDQAGQRFYLIPSPELHMKRLLAMGYERIFQITHVFRKSERGRIHLPEFTLLEWYRVYEDYNSLMADCERLLTCCAKTLGSAGDKLCYCGEEIDISVPFERITVKEAFERFAGWTPEASPDPTRFDLDMVNKVEPGLRTFKRPIFLKDYPIDFASLSRPNPFDKDVAERVELYCGGLELANGFSELTDPKEQARRFEKELDAIKNAGRQPYPWPDTFLKALETLPPCAGMALGVDRLLMLLTDTHEIDQVVSFTPELA